MEPQVLDRERMRGVAGLIEEGGLSTSRLETRKPMFRRCSRDGFCGSGQGFDRWERRSRWSCSLLSLLVRLDGVIVRGRSRVVERWMVSPRRRVRGSLP